MSDTELRINKNCTIESLHFQEISPGGIPQDPQLLRPHMLTSHLLPLGN